MALAAAFAALVIRAASVCCAFVVCSVYVVRDFIFVLHFILLPFLFQRLQRVDLLDWFLFIPKSLLLLQNISKEQCALVQLLDH